jgi:hypothetical protein
MLMHENIVVLIAAFGGLGLLANIFLGVLPGTATGTRW